MKNIRFRLNRLERRRAVPPVSWWDVLVGRGDPADLDDEDRQKLDQLMKPRRDEPCPIEARIAQVANTTPLENDHA